MSDLFGFILSMVSLVLAIGVTHLVKDAANLIRQRRQIRLEPIVFVWAATLFLVAALYWWSLWDFEEPSGASLFSFTCSSPRRCSTLPRACWSLARAGANGRGVESEFERIRAPFMVVMAVFSLLVMCDGWVVGVESAWTAYRPIQLWSVALYIAGAILQNRRAQHLIAWLAFTTYVVAGFFFRFLPGAFGS